MRKKHVWTVKLQADTGQTTERTVKAFWDPEHELTAESVGTAARVAAWLKTGKQTEFFPLAVELIDTEDEPVAQAA